MPTAIILGASSGIGREIAFQLCALGHRIGIAARSTEKLSQLSADLGPDNCLHETFDAALPDAATAGLRRLHQRLGVVDYVYLVAGTGSPNPDLDWPAEESTLALNCLGFAAAATESMRLFRAQGRGHLVAVTSIAAVRPSGGAPAYGASKAFASAYLEALRYWALRQDLPIAVTEARPGFVATAMMKAPRPFWVATPADAARLIISAALRRKKIAYISPRWRLVAWLMRILPDRAYARSA
jgi:short-subunit dehydrogenase